MDDHHKCLFWGIGKLWNNVRMKLMFLTYQRSQSTLLLPSRKKHLQTYLPVLWEGGACLFVMLSGRMLLSQPLIRLSLKFLEGVYIPTQLNTFPLRENFLLEHRILMRYFIMIMLTYITTWKKQLGLRLMPLLSRPFNAGKMEEELGMP